MSYNLSMSCMIGDVTLIFIMGCGLGFQVSNFQPFGDVYVATNIMILIMVLTFSFLNGLSSYRLPDLWYADREQSTELDDDSEEQCKVLRRRSA